MYKMIVIGVSNGGMEALKKFLPQLSEDFSIPIVIVQHRQEKSDNFLLRHLNKLCVLPVQEPNDKQVIQKGIVYLAPQGYHLLIEDEEYFHLSLDKPVQFARPSIDVLFDSAADVYESQTIGIILTGANSDGSQGLKHIKDYGGLSIVQDPQTARSSFMPQAAIDTIQIDHILPLEKIGSFLVQLENKQRSKMT